MSKRILLAREIHPDLALMYERELRATGVPVVSVPNDLGGFAHSSDLWLEDGDLLDDPDTRDLIGQVLSSTSPPDPVPDALEPVPDEEAPTYRWPFQWWILIVAGTIAVGLAIIALTWLAQKVF